MRKNSSIYKNNIIVFLIQQSYAYTLTRKIYYVYFHIESIIRETNKIHSINAIMRNTVMGGISIFASNNPFLQSRTKLNYKFILSLFAHSTHKTKYVAFIVSFQDYLLLRFSVGRYNLCLRIII